MISPHRPKNTIRAKQKKPQNIDPKPKKKLKKKRNISGSALHPAQIKSAPHLHHHRSRTLLHQKGFLPQCLLPAAHPDLSLSVSLFLSSLPPRWTTSSRSSSPPGRSWRSSPPPGSGRSWTTRPGSSRGSSGRSRGEESSMSKVRTGQFSRCFLFLVLLLLNFHIIIIHHLVCKTSAQSDLPKWTATCYLYFTRFP